MRQTNQDSNQRPLCSRYMICLQSHNLFGNLCLLINNFKCVNDVITRDSAALIVVNHYKQQV